MDSIQWIVICKWWHTVDAIIVFSTVSQFCVKNTHEKKQNQLQIVPWHHDKKVSTTQTNKAFVSNVFVTSKGHFVVNIAATVIWQTNYKNKKLQALRYRNFHFTKIVKQCGPQLNIVRERRMYLGVCKERDMLHLQRMLRERQVIFHTNICITISAKWFEHFSACV